MENKIRELTEKIYSEGIEKGKAESQRLIDEATLKADCLVKDALVKAGEIIVQAKKEASELDANTRSELKLYGSQAIGALKSQAATLITDTVVKQSVSKAFEGDALRNFILRIAERWSANEPLVISTAEAEELKTFFAQKAKGLLDKGVTIKEVNGVKTSFSIAPADGSYKVNFGEAEFEEFLKSFLRPRIVELLF